jgi:hypothetical protein
MSAFLSRDGLGVRRPVPGGTPPPDNGWVHTNSGIHNKVAFLIIQGGTHNEFTVRGIGQFKAQWLFHNVLENRLTAGSGFQNARDATVQEAIDLANKQPPHDRGFSDSHLAGDRGTYLTKYDEACQVRNAFASVGIVAGSGDRDCDGEEDNVDPDNDGDTIPDTVDNCHNKWNWGQANADAHLGDLLGDACDPDMDNDGRENPQDNCQTVPNPGWADWNGDGEGDACDDTDNDGQLDSTDNCDRDVNPGQENQDSDLGDLLGDACDDDIDGDEWLNDLDNCRVARNPGQENTTELAVGKPQDRVGDVCDLCPAESSDDNSDLDGDKRANPCDDDDDGDNVPDGDDNCPVNGNDTQFDWDENDIGWACDPAEREAFGAIVKDINDTKVKFQQPFVVPIPVCPECVVSALPNRWESVINLQLPVLFKALVVDSSGDTIAKTPIAAMSQVVSFKPAVFAKSRLLGAVVAEGEMSYNTEPAPDELRYYLIIEPVPGTDLNQSYDLSLSLAEGIEAPDPLRLFLPALHKP